MGRNDSTFDSTLSRRSIHWRCAPFCPEAHSREAKARPPKGSVWIYFVHMLNISFLRHVFRFKCFFSEPLSPSSNMTLSQNRCTKFPTLSGRSPALGPSFSCPPESPQFESWKGPGVGVSGAIPGFSRFKLGGFGGEKNDGNKGRKS